TRSPTFGYDTTITRPWARCSPRSACRRCSCSRADTRSTPSATTPSPRFRRSRPHIPSDRIRAMRKLIVLLMFVSAPAFAADVDALAAAVDAKVVEWRRDIHAHPELGNREFRTAELVAEHLRALGLEVETGVAHTGVVGILRGAKDGPR